jgi:hypothetical protein
MNAPTRKGPPLHVPSVLKAKPCGLPVVGWKYKPQAWWPELPGKDVGSQERNWIKRVATLIRESNQRFEMLTGSQPIQLARIQPKRLCRDCRKVQVEGIKRYCVACAKSRKREANRRSIRKHRSSVRKTGFSPVGAEALTNAL